MPRVLFFARTVFIQNPAQAINFEFPAMASPSQVIFLMLVCIRLPAHERARGRSQSGGSHNSDVDRLANRAQVGPAASEHLPVAAISLIRTVSDSDSQRCVGDARIGTTFFGTRRAVELHIAHSPPACVRQPDLVSGLSPWCTESPNGLRTKRRDRLERLGSGQCGRRGAAALQVPYRP